MVNYLQAAFVDSDQHMYDPETGTCPAKGTNCLHLVFPGSPPPPPNPWDTCVCIFFEDCMFFCHVRVLRVLQEPPPRLAPPTSTRTWARLSECCCATLLCYLP